MTDITSTLNRIRYVAESGREIAQDNQESDDGWDDPYRELRVNFESILHNVNRLEAAMTTDTTNEAQYIAEIADIIGETQDGRWSLESNETAAARIAALPRPSHDDPTDGAQWWNVVHEDDDGWDVRDAPSHDPLIEARCFHGHWYHAARLECTRADAEQAAVDAWAEAGFAHAPKEPPGPTSVEVTWWAVQADGVELGDTVHFGLYPTKLDAACNCPNGYRIVKANATVSEVEHE